MSPANLPAIVLALALLGVLSVGGGYAWVQTRNAPGTLLSAGAQAAIDDPSNVRPTKRPGDPGPPSARSAGAESTATETGPPWKALTTAQKEALHPLAERWSLLSEAQKRRWLSLAASFASLPADEQAKFHDRMTDWASLSVQQRSQARLNFAVANHLARDDKRAQWEAYLALPDEERAALAAIAVPKPKGAATALRPVPPQKLAQVPAASQANPQRPNPPKIPPVIDHSPRVAAPVTPTAPLGAPPTSSPDAPVVETAPVSVPVATPAALPPLGDASAANSPAPTTPAPVTPDTSGLYPQ
ncbi:DUF3106 domain-containing protein [Paracidovorax sp. MALMAid1276]|uniref:DUF3106 domain-containing protein n=1 Tax=Paracidovorax sp. MALMAid1276 TaxID=3411631 RepID=UPI003B9A1715